MPGTGLPTTKVLKTDGVTITLEDLPGGGGLTIEVGSPAVSVPMRVACTSDGIELSIGASKVLLSAASVSINDGALEVMLMAAPSSSRARRCCARTAGRRSRRRRTRG